MARGLNPVAKIKICGTIYNKINKQILEKYTNRIDIDISSRTF